MKNKYAAYVPDTEFDEINLQLAPELTATFYDPVDALLFVANAGDYLQFARIYYEIYNKMPDMIIWRKFHKQPEKFKAMAEHVILSDGRTLAQAIKDKIRKKL